jgi:streptogramin lyase
MHGGEFEAQMHRGKMPKLPAALRVLRRKGVILLAVILAHCALLGYAAFMAGPLPVMPSDANGVAAVNMASGRLAGVTPLPAPPGAVSAADGSVWVADPCAGQVWRIDPGTGAEAARVPVGGEPGPSPEAAGRSG